MSNNKQSSVEWFAEKLKSQGLLYCEPDNLVAFDQAKAMHKQEMIEFAQEVFRNRYNQVHQSLSNIYDDIYNETFGGNNEQQ